MSTPSQCTRRSRCKWTWTGRTGCRRWSSRGGSARSPGRGAVSSSRTPPSRRARCSSCWTTTRKRWRGSGCLWWAAPNSAAPRSPSCSQRGVGWSPRRTPKRTRNSSRARAWPRTLWCRAWASRGSSRETGSSPARWSSTLAPLSWSLFLPSPPPPLPMEAEAVNRAAVCFCPTSLSRFQTCPKSSALPAAPTASARFLPPCFSSRRLGQPSHVRQFPRAPRRTLKPCPRTSARSGSRKTRCGTRPPACSPTEMTARKSRSLPSSARTTLTRTQARRRSWLR
mmetsp:Transcript_65179/g.131087  ORF Transcript_65179/g.131087 Transcript_65179/m.131087 type:complete len:282 (+) Transcript_65179:683-1528(+)